MEIKKGQKVASKGSSKFGAMNATEQAQLANLTINEAIEAGHITSLGDGDVFIKKSEKVDAYYAIVNGKVVRCSEGVELALSTIPEQIGDLVFSQGISNKPGEGEGKAWFRLGLPKGYNLSDAAEDVVRFDLAPVAEEQD